MNKTDVKILKRGLRRVVLALLTTVTFLVAVAGLVAVVFLPGYAAVLVFIASLLVLATAFGMLYGHGMNPRTHTESTGDGE